MHENIITRIKNKFLNFWLILFRKEFKHYRTWTEVKKMIHRNTPNPAKLQLLKSTDNIYSFKFSGNDFIFHSTGDFCIPALEWSYYEIILNSNSNHYYEKYNAKVKNGDIIFDCGACEGFFAYSVKNVAKKIYCFEPNDEMAACLTKTFLNNPNIEIINKGIGKNSGFTCFFGIDPAGFRKLPIDSSIKGKNVEIISIDEFVEKNNIYKVDFIKADVEGSELEMIYGAENVIKKFKPKISITTYHSANDANQIVKALLSFNPKYNYRICGISDTGVFRDEKDYEKPRPMMAYFWM